MDAKVRQGLGLLVVALIGWLVAITLGQMGGMTAARVVAAPAMLAGLTGLVLVAWGLLRPASD